MTFPTDNLIDLASVGLIGTKAGFSTSPEAQIKQILDVATDALTTLSGKVKAKQQAAAAAAEKRRELQSERQEQRKVLQRDGLKDGRLDTLAGNGPIAEVGHGVEKEDELESLCVRACASWDPIFSPVLTFDASLQRRCRSKQQGRSQSPVAGRRQDHSYARRRRLACDRLQRASPLCPFDLRFMADHRAICSPFSPPASVPLQEPRKISCGTR